jgi:hypothetical protein
VARLHLALNDYLFTLQGAQRVINRAILKSAFSNDRCPANPLIQMISHGIEYRPIIVGGRGGIILMKVFAPKLVKGTVLAEQAIRYIRYVDNVVRIFLKRTISKLLQKMGVSF